MKSADKRSLVVTGRTEEILSVARCREILGDEAKDMSDDQVVQLRDDLAKIADVIIPAIGRAVNKGKAPH